jgi:hypothetical protein
MKFKELVDHLDPKPKSKEPESMTLDKFMSLLNPTEKSELEKAEQESRKKSDQKKRKRKE